MFAFYRKTTGIGLLCLVMFCFCAILPAATVSSTSAGDWLLPETETLAEALQDSGGTVEFSDDVTGGWINWPTGGGYTIISAPLHTSGTLVFNLNGHSLNGANLDIVTGNATFLFNNGTVGSIMNNFGIGVNGKSTVRLNATELLAANLQIGSTTAQGILTLENGSNISAANVLNIIGVGSLLTLNSGTSVAVTDFSVLDGGAVSSNGEISVTNRFTVGGVGSKLTTNSTVSVGNLLVSTGGSVTINSGADFKVTGDLTVGGVGVLTETDTFARSTLGGTGVLTVGGNLIFKDGADVDLRTLYPSFTATATQSLTIDGVFFHSETGKNFRTTVRMAGDLIADGGAIRVSGGADLSGVSAITANTGSTVSIVGVFSDALTGTAIRTMVALNTGSTMSNLGGLIEILDGAGLSGVGDLIASGGTITVKGADGEKYRSEITGTGVLTISNSGTVNVEGGALLNGRTDVIVGDGSAGTLNISGMNAAMMLSSSVAATGPLIVGNDALGTLKIDGGGRFTTSTTRIGVGSGAAGSGVTVSGTGTGDRHSTFTINGDLVLADTANATMLIEKGAQVTVSGDTILGNVNGTMATLTLQGRAGGDVADAKLNTTGQVIVGNEGSTNLTINEGGNVTSGKETILGKGVNSTVSVSINSDHYRSAWNAGGTAQTPGAASTAYVAPEGNSKLEVVGGVITVTGLFAMAGQDSGYASNYGKAIFQNNGELHMSGGSFFNMNTNVFEVDSIGQITIGSGGIVSGSGDIYAGELFQVNSGTIAPGSRHMYDFYRYNPSTAASPTNDDSLRSLGTLHIYDREDVLTLFHGATFRTELDRGVEAAEVFNSSNLSDHTIVYGNLQFDTGFTVDFSRPLDGRYLLIKTDVGSTISNFTPLSLIGTGTTAGMRINLNGKSLIGNDRLDYSNGGDGGAFTTLESGDTEVWLTIKTTSTSNGNVKTYWTGTASTTEWSMTSRNFRARDITDSTDAVFVGANQFLDGDIVYFDFSEIPSGLRTVHVTEDSIYKGDDFWGKPTWSTAGNVRVAEINVIGGVASTAAGDILIWEGGNIFALDSALYTTLDYETNGVSPSGRFNKIGDGVLAIYNANEFYGGIHLGDEGTSSTGGGRIQLYNEKGLGTYNSMSGFQQKGLVTVHENSTIQIMSTTMTINNRFIVDPGRVLTFEFPGIFTIANNNALASDATTHDGKGGGVFVGDEGRIVYTGTGSLILRDNKAKAGGGIYTELGYTLQVPAYIRSNYVSGAGGGVYAEKYFSLKDGSDISGNAAQAAGGGIYVGNKGTIGTTGDPRFVLHGNSQVLNNLSGGEAGGGVYVEAGREFVILTSKIASTAGEPAFEGGDVWFEGNYAKVGFDVDNPAGGTKNMENAYRNAIHLSRTASVASSTAAKMEISGPYNTYFYDAISGDVGTQVTIRGVQATADNVHTSEAAPNYWPNSLPSTQYGTTIFHADSEFYGNTFVLDGATLRLESNGEGGATYGRRGTTTSTTSVASTNSFTLGVGSWITGEGTIAADVITLSGNLNLDTGTFSRPGQTGDSVHPNKDGTGAVVSTGNMQGVLNLDGEVSVEKTSNWYLTLNTAGNGTADVVHVTGSVDFDETAGLGKKLNFYIDDLLRGVPYLVLSATDGISDYNRDKTKSDAGIWFDNGGATPIDLTNNGFLPPYTLPVGTDPDLAIFGRLKATSYVEAAADGVGENLYLHIAGRNRHVTLLSNSNWGYNPDWKFDTTGSIPVPDTATVVPGFWEKHDKGPATEVYLDGDMVTISGGATSTVTLTSNVRPVDLFVTGLDGQNVTITNTTSTTTPYGITTFPITSTAAAETTIRPVGSTDSNDYEIPYYTGKLYKSNVNTLIFSNTGTNTFTEGVVFSTSATASTAGIISFGNVNQLVVGAGRTIDFLDSGTLRYTGTASTTLHTAASATAGTGIRIANAETATFDIANTATALTVSGTITNYGATDIGAIAKTGTGTLTLTAANSFSGGTTFNAGNAGTIIIGNNTALGEFDNTRAKPLAGVVTVIGTGTIDVNTARTVQNRFIADTGTLTFGNAYALTIQNVNIGNAIEGGGVRNTGTALGFSNGGSLTLNKNQAKSGGGIYDANSSPLTISKALTFTENRALDGSGGGFYRAAATTFGATTIFIGNTASSSGGGLYNVGAVTFNAATTVGGVASTEGNTATAGSGGGIYAGGTATFGSTLDAYRNTAGSNGGALYAASNVSVTGAANIGATTAGAGNTAGGSGGGIYTEGSANFLDTLSAYRDVASSSGGAIYAVGNVRSFGTAILGNAAATGSTAGVSGGAVYSRGNVTFDGAVTLFGNTAMTGSGGGIWAENGTVSLTGTGTKTIASNTALSGTGGAVYAKNINLSMTTTGTMVISSNRARYGGAFAIAGAADAPSGGLLTLNADTGSITFSTNAAVSGLGDAVYLGDYGNIDTTAAANRIIWFNNNTLVASTTTDHTLNKYGTGLLAFTGNTSSNNIFRGTTNVTAGEFRVSTGAAYGYTAAGTNFTLDYGALLTGGGRIASTTITLNGVVSPDKNVGAVFSTNVPTADRIGTLTFDGNATMYSNSTAGSYQYVVHLGTTNNDRLQGEADRIVVNGIFNASTTNGKVIINLHNYNPGAYLLINATGELQIAGDSAGAVNGINGNSGAFDILVHNFEKTDRHEVRFARGDALPSTVTVTDSTSASQLWLVTAYNNLYMHWTGADGAAGVNNVWQAYNNEMNGNWLDKSGIYGETHFENADSVVFGDTYPDSGTPSNRTITIATTGGGVTVTNMRVNSTGTYSFSGSGIKTTSVYAGDKLDPQYVSSGNATQRLEKLNTGTLTFTNTGGNIFTGGIVFQASTVAAHAGTITFTLANQLGDGGNGITFEESGTLQANATIASLTNNLHLGDGKTATFNVSTAANVVTHTGKIDEILPGDMGHFAKTGPGTLSLNNVNSAWTGASTVGGGTLIAVGVGSTTGSLGMNDAARTITISTNANLTLQIAGTETLKQRITGAGSVTKTTTGTLTLDRNDNDYSGGTTVSANGGTLTGWYADYSSNPGSFGTGTITIFDNATLEYNMHATGTAYNLINGTGILRKTQTNEKFDLTLDNVNNNFSGNVIVSGGTSSTQNYLIANDSRSLGDITSTTHFITLTGLYDYLRVVESAQNNTIASTINGAGRLEKVGTFATVLSGNNTFTGGTDLHEGMIVLGGNAALGTYTGSGAAGVLDFTGDNTTVLSTFAGRTATNRFVVSSGITGATLEARANLTVQKSTNAAANAAVEVGADAEMTIFANGGSITFSTAAANRAPDVLLTNSTSSLILDVTSTTSGIFLNSGISGTAGTVTKTGLGMTQIASTSVFNGVTTVDNGTFRVIGGAIYGGPTGTFTASSSASGISVVAGAGTIKAEQITLEGIVSPDSAVLNATTTTITTAARFGTLTFDGKVDFASSFMFNYNSSAPVASTTVTTGFAGTTGDLIRTTGGNTGDYFIHSGTTVNFVDTLSSGKYLIFISDGVDFTPEGGNLDGIKSSGVMKAIGAAGSYSPRGLLEFIWGTDAGGGDIESQIWLSINRNTLEMTWKNTPQNNVWISGGNLAGDNFLSKQVSSTGSVREEVFNDGDYVIFSDTASTTVHTITIGNGVDLDGVLTCGVRVSGTTHYTFTGDNIIAVIEDKTIEGDFIPSGDFYASYPVNPDGKLQKSGTGTLTFDNKGNLFSEGIDIESGIVGFNSGNQLQVGSTAAITFTGVASSNARLQANASTTLATNIVVSTAGRKGTIDTLSNKLTYTGTLTTVDNGEIELHTEPNGFFFLQGAGNITGTGTVRKTGTGTFQADVNSTFSGITSVDEGFFRVTRGISYGTTSTGGFMVNSSGAVAGGGTIKSFASTVRGVISPDSAILSATTTAVSSTSVDRFGILTFDGPTTLVGFTMKYDNDVPKFSKDETTVNTTTGDLLRFTGGTNPLLLDGTIDIQHISLNTGWYLIAESETSFDLNGEELDGISHGGVLHLTRQGFPVNTESPRNWYEFEFGKNSDDIDDARIWLHADTNSLTMHWTKTNGTGSWSGSWATEADDAATPLHWISEQSNPGISTTQYSYRFRSGDYTYFNVDTDAVIEIVAAPLSLIDDDNIVPGVIVSGLVVDGSVETKFTGVGGIHAKKEDETWIIGKYLFDSSAQAKPALTPDGKLQKFGSGTLTFENSNVATTNGGNLFNHGIDIAAGTIGFNNGNQLRVGSTAAITFTGLASSNARLQANADLMTLAANIISTTMSKGTIDTQTFKLTHTGSITVASGGEIELASTAGGFLFQNGAVTGNGAVTKTGNGTAQIGTNSNFSGASTVSGGTFRVAHGVSYGTAGTGTFTVTTNGTIAGGTNSTTTAVISATTAAIYGTISADSATLSTTNVAISTTASERFGVLTIDANTTLYDGFRMDYDAQTAQDAVPRGDLLKIINGKTLTFNTGTINLLNTDSRLSGQYLIMEADGAILHPLDNDPDRILTATINGNAMNSLSVRGRYSFHQRQTGSTADALTGNQIWLDVENNSLNMIWQDSTDDDIWTNVGSKKNWLSIQGTGTTKDTVFQNGDYVHFLGSTTKSITVDGAIIVSGFEMDANVDYTFTGTGTINAYKEHGTIEGRYLPSTQGGTSTPTLIPDGKLNKRGAGVLTFRNGANTFHEGIVFSSSTTATTAGVIAFNNANQLGDGGKGITFEETGTLRSNANIPSLTNNFHLGNGVTATFDTNNYNMTLRGTINEIIGTANVVKDGQGVLSLTNTANGWDGTTNVLAGTLQAVGVETLGTNIAGRTITVDSGAKLELRIDGVASTETLAQKITGAGAVEKTGLQTLILTNDNDYTGGTIIAGGKIVAETLNAVGSNVTSATGIIAMSTGTTLELKLETGEGGTFLQRMTGNGKLIKSGNSASTLTLSRNDNNYMGGTDINSGRITITNVGAVGDNVATGIVNLNGTTTSLELALTADGTFNQLIAGSGQLVKTANTEATLTNANTFTGGTELNAGTLVLDDAQALNITASTSGAVQGFVFVTGNATVKAGTGVTAIQNRFVVSTNRQLTLNSLDIIGNDVRGVNGGAIELQSGASFVTTGDPLDLLNNKTDGSGGAIYAPNATITIGGTGNNTINSLRDNTAGANGGGIYAQAVIVKGGQTISGNTAGTRGGALYLVGGVTSALNATGGDITFQDNNDANGTNAIYMDTNVTLNFTGNRSIYLRDGISSKASQKNGNLVDISMDFYNNLNNVVVLSGNSEYYGDTEFKKGLLQLDDAHWGATATDVNTFRQYEETVLFGVGTVQATDILLGGTINAGVYSMSPRISEIAMLEFIGSTKIGDLSGEGLGVTKMYIDLNASGDLKTGLYADLISVDGTLTFVGHNAVGNRTLNDLDTSANGKFLIAQTTGGVNNYVLTGELNYEGQPIINNFDTLIAGENIIDTPGFRYRFNLYYTLENNGKDIYLNIDLQPGQLVWNSRNEHVTESTTWDDDWYDNKWVNEPTYNWENYDKPPTMTPLRYLQKDRVVFDSVADTWRTDYEEIRKNIEIITHTNDTFIAGAETGEPAKATVRDMLVLGGGTYRFTGLGINGVYDNVLSDEIAKLYLGGQLYISGSSNDNITTVIFDNEANNFQRGIVLQNGALGFSDPNQLGTTWVNDKELGGDTTRGIFVAGYESYGILYVNADNMTLRTPIVIDRFDSEFIVDTDGNAFGNDNVLGNYTLTIGHLNDGTGVTNGISGDGKLVKEGLGTLILADENYYKGGTDILGGTIAVARDNRLGQPGSRVYFNDGTLLALESFTANRTANLGIDGGTLETADVDTQLTWNDLITGTGDLTTAGPGTVLLTSTLNNYAGNTIVADGRLIAMGLETLGTNSTTRSITTTLLDPDTKKRSVLELQLTKPETLRQTLLGDGEVLKNGTGSLTLAQSSPDFKGHFNFAQGSTYLNAEFQNSDSFVVGTDATLYGTGWLGSKGGGDILGTLIPNGVIANDPKVNPTATFLNISGNLSFGAGSLYQVVITQYPGSTERMIPVNDKIIVDAGGIVKIDGNAELDVTIDFWADNLSILNFGEATSDKFTIIDAQLGLVDDPSAMFMLRDVELPRGVELMHGWNGSLYQLWFLGNPSGSFRQIGRTHNQKEIGKVLDFLTLSKDPGMNELVRILSQKEITDDMVRDILSQLAGDLRANALGMALKAPWKHPFSRIDRDMFPRPFDPCQPITCRPEYKYKSELWAEAYGNYAKTRFDGNSYANSVHRAGMVLGFDQRICDYSLVGALFNYSHPTLHQATGRAEVNDYEIGIYNLTKLTGKVDLKSYFGYSYQDYHLHRHVFIPAGSRYGAVHDSYRNTTHGDTFAMSFELLRPIDCSDRLTVTPLIALDYEHVWQKGYAESGGITALRYDSTMLEHLMMRVGINTKLFVHNRLDLHTKVQYATQLNRTEYPRSAPRFANATIDGAPSADIWGNSAGRDQLILGLSGEYYLNKKRSASVHLGYDANMWRRMTMHTGTLGYTHRW